MSRPIVKPIYNIVTSLFSEANKQLTTQLWLIYSKQHDYLGSTSFFYKGDVYYFNKEEKMNPLHPELHKPMNTYLKQRSNISTKSDRLNHLLRDFVTKNELNDLFYVFPKEAIEYLDSFSFRARPQEHIDKILSEVNPEINHIIKEQLLHNLLL